MNMKAIVLSVSLVLAGGAALAQGMMGRDMMQGGDRGMMGGGMMQRDNDQGMMGRRNMMQGRMGSMMCPMMGEMMQTGMMDGGIGMGALFGSRVVPKMNLSVDDVRSYLSAKLDQLGNKRLKLGNINIDGGLITADIVTADNSLVQRMKVDRGTGDIQYEN